MIELIILALAQVAAGEPAQVPQDAPSIEASETIAVAEQPATDPEDVVVCRTVQTTGSRVSSRRICSSRNADELEREATRQAMRENEARSIPADNVLGR
ncbi:MAG: hypothetical protein ABL864_01420 [Terricaulis sp.]